MEAGRGRSRAWRALCAAGFAGWACAAEPAAREAELAAAALAQRAGELQAALERLREENRRLQVSLAAARAEIDVLRARREADAWKSAEACVTAGALDAGPIAVVEVSRDLNLVVMDAGAARGIRPGMQFGVVRDGRAVARIRAVDVRERIAGAVVEEAESGRFPGKGDRVVVRKGEDR